MRVLVTPATRHEATREITEAIAAGLMRRGLDVETQPIEDVEGGLGGYDGVVLGSAVYMGRWLKPARRFAQENAAALAGVPVWLFSSGPVGPPGRAEPDSEPVGEVEGEPTEVLELAELIGARGHAVFAGRLENERLSLAERAAVKVVHAPQGDYRDWEQIDAFAGEIAAHLAAAAGR